MDSQAGNYSFVCFIDVQRGGWFGPIADDLIDDYEYGFALDDNIKSFTRFQYYTTKPLEPLSCNFSSSGNRKPIPKTITYDKCTVRDDSGDKQAATHIAARKLT